MSNEMPKYEELTTIMSDDEIQKLLNSIQNVIDDKHLDELSAKLPF